MLQSPIEEIKNRLDIVELIGSYLKLQKCGVNFRATCPFHSEKKPSFFVSPARQTWHCFGCQKGGSIFNFIMEIEGVEFREALRILAQKAGVELRPISPKLKTEKEHFYEINELAAKFFQKQLSASPSGKKAKEYLLKRGISEDSQEKWRLGWAPESWQGLSDFLTSQGYAREEIVKAGLAIKDEKQHYYDRFRTRIMFPIFDLNSQVIGFTGRIFAIAGKKSPDEAAKYVNTPNTLLYDKSKVLYGLDRAKLAIRQKNQAILVEGQTDVIMAHQVGVENVVASSGTALTGYQLTILKRYSDNLMTGFDMDLAGNSATQKGVDLAQKQGFDIKVIIMPKDRDPADIISADPKQWLDLVSQAKSIYDFYFEIALTRHNSETPEGKKEIAKILLPIIKQIPNQIEKGYWLQKLSREIGIKEDDLLVEMKKIPLLFGRINKTAADNEKEIQKKGEQKTRPEILEEQLLCLILKKPANISIIKDDDLPYFSDQTQKLLGKLRENPEIVLTDLPSDLTDFFDIISLKSEIEELPEEQILLEIQFCLKEIKKLVIKKQLDGLSWQIKKAEEQKKTAEISRLSADFNQLCQKLSQI